MDASALYRLLGDDARLRLLRLLALERLNVTELTGILGLAQSGVSRHLGLLKDGGLVSRGARGGLHVLPDCARGLRRVEWPLDQARGRPLDQELG